MPSSASNSDLKCPAQRDVETVWLPIEIVLERPQEIVEVRDLRIHLIGDLLQIFHGEDRRVQLIRHLLGEVDHLLQDRHGVRLDLSLLVGVGVLLLGEWELLAAPAALCGEQVGKRGMSSGRPRGLVMLCTIATPGSRMRLLATRSNEMKSAELRIS